MTFGGALAPSAAETAYPIDLFCFWLRTALLKRADRTGLALEQGGHIDEVVDKQNGPAWALEPVLKRSKRWLRCAETRRRSARLCHHGNASGKNLAA